jgi:chemotaxis protein CheD
MKRAKPGDDHANRPSRYLHPGEIFAAAEPFVVTTVLGTCVSVCLWDARRRLGGMNHFLLPFGPNEAAGARYGESACQELIARVLGLGAQAKSLEAKVFGGMRSPGSSGSPGRDLGSRNIEIALRSLEAHRIPVAALDVGNEGGMKLIFDLASGDAWVKHLGQSQTAGAHR